MPEGTIVPVAFEASVHSVDAMKRAAYAFMARAEVVIEPHHDKVICNLRPLSDEAPDTLTRDFRREVLDQDLRLEIEAKTEPLRNMVLGLAFSHLAQRD